MLRLFEIQTDTRHSYADIRTVNWVLFLYVCFSLQRRLEVKDKSVYSYHTFILPFVCEGKRDIYELFDNQAEGNIWENTDEKVELNSLRTVSYEDIDEKKGYYDAYKFFNEAGRNLVFSDEKVNNVRNYEIKKEVLNGVHYVIGTPSKEYSLPIKKISLKIYNTDINILVIECKNSDYRTIDDVKRINEYGRRLGLPFWPGPEKKYCKCADYLRITKLDGSEPLAFDNFLKDIEGQNISLAYISKIVRMLLDKNGSGYTFRGKSAENEYEIQMRTLLEEKMFVASFVCDERVCKELYSDFKKENDKFSASAKKNLLELMRVDLPGECSIGNEQELDLYIKEHVYMTSFSEDSKKLMMVTDQAYIKLAPDPGYEEGYFENAYVPLILIPIVQRNSIESFHLKIQELTELAQKKINMLVIRRIMNVQQKYVMFRNQFLPGIVTAQKEGKYLYSKLQMELCVSDENKVLEGQVGKLFEQASINQSYAFSKWGLTLSLTSLTLSAASFINTAHNISKIGFSEYNGIWVILITLSVVLTIVSVIIFGFFNSRRKK